jgi:hypothetical protein
MTPHDHTEYVPGCHRCELSRDEAKDAGQWTEWRLTIAELQTRLQGRQPEAVVILEMPPDADGVKVLWNVDVAPRQVLNSPVLKLAIREPPDEAAPDE